MDTVDNPLHSRTSAALQETIRKKKCHLQKRLLKSMVVRPTVNFHTLVVVCSYSVMVPHLEECPADIRERLRRKLIDLDVLEDLESAKVLNWCRTLKPLYPLSTMGDGNCLLHAVSMAMWGIHDCGTLLRRLVYTALVEDTETNKLKQRWRREKTRQNDGAPQLELRLDSQEWQQDWEGIVCAADDTKKPTNTFHYESLEEIHIFVLANVLKRPIIVLADTVVRSLEGSVLDYSNIHGVYLPILWSPDECVKSPIVLGYNRAHFVPLVGMEEPRHPQHRPVSAEHGVALVRHDLSPIPIHFLTDQEEHNATSLLQTYLKVTEVTRTIADSVQLVLIARMDYTIIEEEFNIFPLYVEALKASFLDSSETRKLDNILFSDPREEPRFSSTTSDFDTQRVNGALQGSAINNSTTGPPSRSNVESPTTETVTNNLGAVTTMQTTSTSTSSSSTQPRNFDNIYVGTLLAPVGGATITAVQMEQPVQGLVEPTAPRYSLLSTRTAEESMSNRATERVPDRSVLCPSGGSRASLDPFTSAVAQYCPVDDCMFNASRNTFPFCHEHDPSKVAGPPTHRYSLSDESLSIVRPGNVTLQLMEEENRAQSLGSYEYGGSRPCHIPGCILRGPPSYNGLCTQHYAEEKIMRERHAKSIPAGRTENGETTNPKCRKEDCRSPGKANFTGYCSTCYILHMDEVVPSQRVHCRTPGCTFTGTVANGGFCSQCAMAECIRDAHGEEDDDLNTMEILNQLPQMAREELENARTFEKCKSTNCTGIGLTASLGFCPACYKKLYREQRGIRSQMRHSAPVGDITGTPREGASYYSMLPHMAMVSELPPTRPTRPLRSIGMDDRVMNPDPTEKTSYQEELENVKKCWKPQCNRSGYKVYKDLCQPCYAEMVVVPSNHQAEPIYSHPARTSAMACRSRLCDRYGDPNLHGYCSRCHSSIYPQRAPAAAVPKDEYGRAIKEIESATKSGRDFCKSYRCPNYGNSRCAGYCNKCYTRFRDVDMLER